MENNNNSQQPEHILVAGRNINEPMTIDGGKVCGCTIIAGGTVTVLSQASFVTDCVVSSGGVLDVEEGMILDCSICGGGKLILGPHAVYNHIITASGAEVISAGQKYEDEHDLLLHDPTPSTEEKAEEKQEEQPSEQPVLFKVYTRTNLDHEFLRKKLKFLMFKDTGDSNTEYRLEITDVNFCDWDEVEDGLLLYCYGWVWQLGDHGCYVNPEFILNDHTYLKLTDITFIDGNSAIPDDKLPGFIEVDEVWYQYILIPWIGDMTDQCEVGSIYLDLVSTAHHTDITSRLSTLELIDHRKKYCFQISTIKTLESVNSTLLLELRGHLYDSTFQQVDNMYIDDDDSEFKFVKFNDEVKPLTGYTRVRKMIFRTGPKSYGVRIPMALMTDVDREEMCDSCPSKTECKDMFDQALDEDLNKALADDAQPGRFNGVNPDRLADEHDELIDSKNRTVLKIKGRCNYTDVIDNIRSIMFRFREHVITIWPCRSDDCDDVEATHDDDVTVVIRHLPRMLIEDDDLELVDVIFDQDTPEDLRFGIDDASYEDHFVSIDLDEDHDEHIYEICEERASTSTVIIEGKLQGNPSEHWSGGSFIISSGNREYFIIEEPGTREASLDLDNLSFKITLHPIRLEDRMGKCVEDDDIYEILHHCTLSDVIGYDRNSLLQYEHCTIDGLDIPIMIPWIVVRLSIEGYTLGTPNVWTTFELIDSKDPSIVYTVLDYHTDRIETYDKNTHFFSVLIYPTCLERHGKLIVGREMMEILATAKLHSLRISEEFTGDLEISRYTVNGVRKGIDLKDVVGYKQFVYQPISKDAEKEPSCDAYPSLKITGDMTYFMPAIRVFLVIREDGLEKSYRMYYGRSDTRSNEGSSRTTTYTNVEFSRGRGDMIKSPDEVFGKNYKFVVESIGDLLGMFKPKVLTWGHLTYNFE